jgi:Glycosyltransferase (GlcNAc)
MKSIFVSVASYRDTDVQNTVDDLFAKATFPDRVTVGVYLQIDPELDRDCLVRIRTNLSVVTIDAKKARGAGAARAAAQRLWNGEDYFFQVDSHMRFVQGWDETLISMLAECPSEWPVLSTYPLPFTPPNDFNPDRYVVIKPKSFDVDGVMLQNSGMFPFNGQGLAKSPYISAGMLFGPASMIVDVPYDPYIPFTGEEISLGLRLFSHGYDVFIPNKVIAYHNYNLAPERPRIWKDQDLHANMGAVGRARVLWLCGQTTTALPEKTLVGMDKYGLGCKRSLAQYEAFAELDFRNRLWKGQKSWP